MEFRPEQPDRMEIPEMKRQHQEPERHDARRNGCALERVHLAGLRRQVGGGDVVAGQAAHTATDEVQEADLIQHAVACNTGTTLDMPDFISLVAGEDIPKRNLRVLRQGNFNLQASFDAFPSMEVVEHLIIEEALRMTEGNKTLAADLLGISRPTLNRKLEANQG